VQFHTVVLLQLGNENIPRTTHIGSVQQHCSTFNDAHHVSTLQAPRKAFLDQPLLVSGR